MMKKSILDFLLILLSVFCLFFINNCKQEGDNVYITTAKESTIAEKIFTDVKSIADEAVKGSLQTFIPAIPNTILSGCITIIHDTTVNPRKLTINFGNDPECISLDGLKRSGKIIVSYSGVYENTTDSIYITFENYSVNNNVVNNSSKLIIKNTGRDTSGNLCYNVKITGSILKSGNSGTIDWVANRTYEWISGEKTPLRSDDEFLISGNTSGSGSNGFPWHVAITEKLHLKLSCKWITGGNIKITSTGFPDALLDYGNGSCDSQSTVTINNKNYYLTL